MAKKEKPPKGVSVKTDIMESVGKVFINLGQVVFGTLFLGGVLHGKIPHYVMMATGISGAVILIFFGILLSTKGQKDKKE